MAVEYRADVGSALLDVGGAGTPAQLAYLVAHAQTAGSVPTSEVKLVVVEDGETRPATSEELAEFSKALDDALTHLRGERS